MRINGLPNKFEIFQDFYLNVKGQEISYKEALRLFREMDYDTERDFVEYYADEIGYDLAYKTDADGNLILDSNGNPMYDFIPFVSPNGYYSIESSKTARKAYIGIKHSLEAYAVKNGLVLDPIWSQYSAEEIIQMDNNGVLIPQDIVDIAYTIMESSTSNYNGNATQEGGEGLTAKDKDSFLELIPKAVKNIKNCNEKTEKIDDKIDDLLGEGLKQQKIIAQEAENKLDEFKEYEEQIREWRHLQDKINNGEELTDSEARKYAQITGMLQEKNHNSSDFQLDKFHTGLKLNDINILAVLGEQLAEETIEIGDELTEYTSNSNYKRTYKEASGQIGFLRAIVALIHGEQLGKEANKVGNNTKEYTEDTEKTVNNVSSILGVESMISKPGAEETSEETPDTSIAENEAVDGTDSGESSVESSDNNAENEKAAQNENVTNEEDFIINDENILELIKQAGEINVDLLKEIKTALINLKMANDDKDYAAKSKKLIDKIVKEYQEEEARRQEEIKAKEQENKDAQDRIDEIKGDDETGEKAKEYGVNPEDSLSEEDKKELDEKQALIDQNNKDIEQLKEEQEQAQENFAQKVSRSKTVISKQIPEEMKALENDGKYSEEIIPEDKKQLKFTHASGGSLYRMGKYRVKVGAEMLASGMFVPYLRLLGLWHIARGTMSAGIGLAAQVSSQIPTPKLAEKATKSSVKGENGAIDSLNELDVQISSITGEQTEAEKYQSSENSEENQDGSEDGENDVTDEETVETDSADTLLANGDTTEETNPVTRGMFDEQTDVTDNLVTDLTEENSGIQEVSENILGTVENTEEETQKSEEETQNPEDEVHNPAEETGNPGRVGQLNNNTEDTPNTSSGNKKEEDKSSAADVFSGKVLSGGKSDAKDAEQVKNDTEKDEKQLDKEAKVLQRQMKKDEKQIIKMTKESMRAAKKQEELLGRYEEYVKENEEIAAQEEKKQLNAPAPVMEDNAEGAQNPALQSTNSAESTSKDNLDKFQFNNQEITVLSNQFKVQGNIIDRNRARITRLEKNTKTNYKKFSKKTSLRQKKIREAEKKEADRQKKLAKQLAVVGIGENICSITIATGYALIATGWAASVGSAMVNWGTWALVVCGVTKGIINLANGNTTAGLIALGQAALAAVGAVNGAGAQTVNVTNSIAQGLSVVSNSTELVNNVRTLEGKEANGTLSKISTIAGTAQAITSAASVFEGGAQWDGEKMVPVDSAFSQADKIGKAMMIANVAGSAISGTSQIMTEFGIGNEKTAQILGTIGGSINMAASIATIATTKKNLADKKNADSQNTMEQAAQQGDNNGSTDGAKNADGTESTDGKGTEGENADKSKADDKASASSDNTVVTGVKTRDAVSQNPATSEVQQQVKQDEVQIQEQQQTIEQANDDSKATMDSTVEDNQQAEKTRAQKKAEKQNAKDLKKQQEQLAKGVQTQDEAQIQNVIENGSSIEFSDVDDLELAAKISLNGAENELRSKLGLSSLNKTEQDALNAKLTTEQQNRQTYQSQIAQGGETADTAKAAQTQKANELKSQLNTEQKVENITKYGSSYEFASYDDAKLNEIAKSGDSAKAKAAQAELDKRNNYQKTQEALAKSEAEEAEQKQEQEQQEVQQSTQAAETSIDETQKSSAQVQKAEEQTANQGEDLDVRSADIKTKADSTIKENVETEETKGTDKTKKTRQESKAEKEAEKTAEEERVQKAEDAKKSQKELANEVKAEDEAKLKNIVELGSSKDYSSMDDSQLAGNVAALEAEIKADKNAGVDTSEKTKKLDALKQEQETRKQFQENIAQGGETAKKALATQKELAKKLEAELKQKVENITELGSSKEFAQYDEAELDEMIEFYQGEGNNPDMEAKARAERNRRNEYQKEQKHLEERKQEKSQKREDIFEAVSKGSEVASNVLQMFANQEQEQQKKKGGNPELAERYRNLDMEKDIKAYIASMPGHVAGNNSNQNRRFKKFEKHYYV